MASAVAFLAQWACPRPVAGDLNLPVIPRRIECFDISHIQGTDKVASMVVWKDGRMKRQDYRKFIIRTVVGNDDCASMRELVTRRYSRLGIINPPLASIAKREEIIYVLGQENEPVVLDRFSPILHLIQSVRDEAHRFAVTFHRTRRNASRLTSEVEEILGVGKTTVTKLLKHFGSSALVRAASEDELAAPVGRAAARRVKAHYTEPSVG